MESDEVLVSRIKRGEILAFEELVKRYQGRLLGFTGRMLGNREEAEEVVQDALVSVYLHISRVDQTRKFSTFLFEIAKNGAISRLRRRKKTVAFDEETMSEEVSVYEKFFSQEEQSRVREAVLSLPDKFRGPIKLYYFEGLSYEQISEKLGIPINTVRTFLKRGKETLKEKLHE